MADDRKLDLHLDLLHEEATGARVSGTVSTTSGELADDRFPDVDDILDRLTVNTKAVEQK
jgi:hypothetical protein